MNITKQDISPVQARINVQLDESDYKDKVAQEIKKIGRTRQIPGFRVGHVPSGELMRRFGKPVTADVVNDLVYQQVFKYIEDNKLGVLGHPIPVDVKEVATSGPMEFSYDLALIPVLQTEPDKELHVPYFDIEVTDQMIDEQSLNMRKRGGKQVPGDKMEADALVKGPIFQLNEDGTRNENEGAIQMTNGIVFPMYFKDKEETAKFENAKVGDTVRFNPYRASGGDAGEIASMLGIDKTIAADIKGDFEMAVTEFIINEPAELSQEFYDQTFGKDKIHDEKEYREAVKQIIAADLRNESNRFFRMAFDKLFQEKNAGVELPDELMVKMFFSKAEKPEEAYKMEKDAVRNEVLKLALKQKFNVQATEEEILEAFKSVIARQFAQYGLPMQPEVLDSVAKERIKEDNNRAQIAQQVEDNKLYQKIFDSVTLDKKSVPLDKFQEAVHDFFVPAGAEKKD